MGGSEAEDRIDGLSDRVDQLIAEADELNATIAQLRAAVRAADAFFAGWKAGDRSRWESAYAEYMADRAKCGEVT